VAFLFCVLLFRGPTQKLVSIFNPSLRQDAAIGVST
jgi:hypothetical protein